jgi:uncharacterized membrane protein YdbT with pleckstrin-like domain
MSKLMSDDQKNQSQQSNYQPQKEINLDKKPASKKVKSQTMSHHADFDHKGRVEHINEHEKKIFEIHRHKIAIILLILQVAGGLMIGFILIGLLLPGFADALGVARSTVGLLAVLSMSVLSFLAIGFLFIAAYIDRSNRLILSSENVTLVNQVGLFNKKVSELVMSNIEDVTVQKSGILPTIFNYGTVVIETAGEQNNFTFKYVGNPDAYAKAIQDAKGLYLSRHATSH